MHSTPVANGQWLCERYQLNPTDEQQRWGCQSHMYNPHLLYPWAEVLDSGDYWYQFAIKATGEIITTGEGGMVVTNDDALADRFPDRPRQYY